ncbi:putative EF-hand and coiled-coil domain-containing protein 1 isoform X2 [Penaeus vannamei]|uniref:Putative EF-hand and coiled-coil domain-containing protein 1 isoform X2 n=1 Tax=Penaeus vannamei TaxID=6689 RepID=A0A423U2R4_PENVA|nr:putative EF-hand and coiled-coil domain-containing protein 1 isoform X2 [Penaeus vannamei]
MDSGRSAGAGMGGPRGLVAGVKAAFRSRSRSEKSRSRSRSRCENSKTDDHDEVRPGKGERAPRSPFLGWARSRHKEQPKAKEAAKAKEVAGGATEASGPCSLLQAERLSLHSSEDYWHTSEDLRDIRRGTYTSFRSDFYDSKYAGEKENEKTLDRLRLLVDDGAATRLQDSRERTGRLGRYVNLPVHCAGVAGQVPGESSARAGAGGLALGVNASNHRVASCGVAAALESQGPRYYDKEKTPEAVRGSWLKSALSYNLEVPESPRNEVIVLALGIDQYIEEVFRFLDRSGSGRVGIEDFHALCQVLGLAESEGLPRKGQQRCQCLGSKLTLNGSLDNSLLNNEVPGDKVCPIHLNFSEFHDRLCECFVKGAQTETLSPLASRRPCNPRLVTSVVHIQRRYDILEKISKSIAEINSELEGDAKRPPAECPTAASACCTSRQPAHVDRNSNISPQPSYSETCLLKRQVLLQQQELQCLREVIEDMRVALQNSDAENLSLQVQMARSSAPSRRGSEHDLCLTDEEDTIDDLVRQLTELSRPRNDLSSIPVAEVAPQPQEAPKEAPQEALQADDPKCKMEAQETASRLPEPPGSPKDAHNTAFVSGDLSLEAELQATYEALQAAREEQEATQADLQRTVSELQQREADLKGAELSLQASYTALEKVQYDSHALVMEVAETRSLLEDTKERLAGALEELAQAKSTMQEQEAQLTCAKESLEVLQNSR